MIEENSKLKARIDEESRVFAYSIDPNEWKSFTPLLRRDGYKAGAVHEIKRSLVLIDALLLQKDSEVLKTLRRQILSLDENSHNSTDGLYADNERLKEALSDIIKFCSQFELSEDKKDILNKYKSYIPI